MIRNSLSDGILFSHWSDVLRAGAEWPWKDFTPGELSSKREGEFYYHPRSFDALQTARNITGQPIFLNSAHRSWLHNIAVGGAPGSSHLFFAGDVSHRGYEDNKKRLFFALKKAGFKGFGFYDNFFHVDLSRGRFWFESDALRDFWLPVLSEPLPEVI